MDDWHACHSMHAPEEVRRLVEELNVAEPTIRSDADVERDFEELMPALERIAEKGRRLYVGVRPDPAPPTPAALPRGRQRG